MSHGAVSPNSSFAASILNRKQSTASSVAVLYAPAMSALTLAAFALRLILFDRFPFREDEAAYAYWALHGWLQDPLFLEVWPDKPPIFLWLLGSAFHLFGVSEASRALGQHSGQRTNYPRHGCDSTPAVGTARRPGDGDSACAQPVRG